MWDIGVINMLLTPNDGIRAGRFRQNVLKIKSLFYQIY